MTATATSPAQASRQRKDALHEIVSVLPSITLGATGISYGLGLLIVNIYLNRYGVYTVELVRSDFVLVGAAFIFLVALATTSAARGMVLVRRYPDAWKETKLRTRLWRITTVTVQALFAFVLAPALALVTLSRNAVGLDQWQIWLAAVLLSGTGVHAANLCRQAVQVVREALAPPNGEANTSGLMSQAYFALDVVLSLSLSIGSYALLAYPHLAPAFGGANRDRVVLAPTQAGTEVARHLRLPMDANGDIGPVKLLSDTETELVIVAGDDSSYKTKAIRIRREYISAVVAIAPVKKLLENKGQDDRDTAPAKKSPPPKPAAPPANQSAGHAGASTQSNAGSANAQQAVNSKSGSTAMAETFGAPR